MYEKPLTVLLIEDNPGDAHLLQELLSHTLDIAWTLICAERLSVGLERISLGAIDAVILDLSLPDSQGLATFTTLATAAPQLPVIVLTGLADEGLARQAMRQGAQDYLLKSEIDGPLLVRSVYYAIERKRAQEALQASERHYRSLVEGSLQGIFVVRDDTIRFANQAAADIFGYANAEAFVGQPIESFVASHEEAQLAVYLKARAHGEAVPTRYECQVRHQDGTLRTLEVMVTPITWEDRVATLVTFLDRTEQTRLEGQLRQVQKLEAIGTLAGGIAHDFNNILTPIIGFAELNLSTNVAVEERREHFRYIYQAGRQARELIKQILAFSRQSATVRGPVHLQTQIREILGLVRASLPATIEIHTQLDANVGAVLTDATEIHQVLLNLASNAEHAMRKTGGRLEIRLTSVELPDSTSPSHPPLQPGPYVRLTVRDTGCGMTEALQRRIFEPFFTTKELGEGTGMGLATVHGIVTSHGGAVTVHSVPGCGTTFTIYLPELKTPHDTAGARDAAFPPVTGRGHILLIDDEASVAVLGREMLEALGHEVVMCTSGPEAIQCFRSAPQAFDLVITDQTMPQMTGAMVARELRAIRPNIPIILCTGFGHIGTDEQARTAGFEACLLKPLGLKELAETVRRVLAPPEEEAGN